MQGKEAPEQETLHPTAGVDVSKNWLDAHVFPVGDNLRVANTSQGFRQLKRWLLRKKVRRVAVEATGKWHRALCRSLHEAQIAIAIVDPYRVRQFAKAEGILAKTDRLDAGVLARFAQVMAPACRQPPAEALNGLQELVAGRAKAVEEETALKNQLGTAETAFFQKQLRRRIQQLARHIAALEAESLKRIKADDILARRYAILMSIPGVGPIVAATLIACVSEIGTLSSKQIALLAGLAPIANESGKWIGNRVIWGGRSPVRRILYLAALSAVRSSGDLKAFYRRLTDKGKPPKCALIAVARKMVVLANTLIAQNRTWQTIEPQNA